MLRPDLQCCSPPGRYGPAGRGSPRKPRAAHWDTQLARNEGTGRHENHTGSN